MKRKAIIGVLLSIALTLGISLIVASSSIFVTTGFGNVIMEIDGNTVLRMRDYDLRSRIIEAAERNNVPLEYSEVIVMDSGVIIFLHPSNENSVLGHYGLEPDLTRGSRVPNEVSPNGHYWYFSGNVPNSLTWYTSHYVTGRATYDLIVRSPGGTLSVSVRERNVILWIFDREIGSISLVTNDRDATVTGMTSAADRNVFVRFTNPGGAFSGSITGV